MYRIKRASPTLLAQHVKAVKGELEKRIQEMHPDHGGQTLLIVDNKHLKLTAKVKKGSVTEWFLSWLLEDRHLDNLLTGNMDYLLSVIKMVDDKCDETGADRRLVYCSMTEKLFTVLFNGGREYPEGTTKEEDVFNDVLYHIFVTKGYEDATVFSKNLHVETLNLRICPYCGRQFIYAVEENGTTVKPQIDHFLPKRKYPFLALSFFNLIPVCNTCNMNGCKGNHDPLHPDSQRPFSMIYPYEFKDENLDFHIQLTNSHYYDTDNFKVLIDYKGNTELGNGCKDFLKLDAFYAYHNYEAANIYRQFMVLKSKAAVYYKAFGLPEESLSPTPKLIFGHGFDEKTSREVLLYKFKKDVYEQFKRITATLR